MWKTIEQKGEFEMVPSLCKKASGSKIFAVFVAWATLVVSYTLFGAFVPLLPIYVQEFSRIKSKSSVVTNSFNSSDINNNSSNGIETQCPNNTAPPSAPNGDASRIIGAILGISKAGQVLASPFVGMAIDKIGYDIPLFIGYAIQIGVSIGFIFADGEALLFVLRFIQGIGAAFLNTAAFTVVAVLYQDDDISRGTMLSYVVCGISVGFVVGPPFGSVLYQFGNKIAPFLSIALLMICVASLQLCIRIPRINKIDSSTKEVELSPWKIQLRLLMDPYVDICLILSLQASMGIALLEATLPYHMLSTMCVEKWMLGVVILPMYAGVSLGIIFQSWMTRVVGRWTVALYSYILAAAPLIAYAFCRSFVELLFPGFPLGVFTTARGAAVFPMLTYLVHTRYGPWAYGGAYALADIAIGVAFFSGPVLGGSLMPVIGFDGVMYLVAAITFIAIVPMAFLRKTSVEGKPVSTCS